MKKIKYLLQVYVYIYRLLMWDFATISVNKRDKKLKISEEKIGMDHRYKRSKDNDNE